MRLRLFGDMTIATEEKKSSSPLLDLAKIETAVKRVKGVNSYSLDVTAKVATVGFAGLYSDAKNIKIAIDGQGAGCEILSPARVVIRPLGRLENADGPLAGLRGSAGVVAAVHEFNDLVAYCDLALISLEALQRAAGIKCQIASHDEIKVAYSASGSSEALRKELEETKWVLKVEIAAAETCVKVLTVKGRLTRAAVKSLMEKHGFPEAK